MDLQGKDANVVICCADPRPLFWVLLVAIIRKILGLGKSQSLLTAAGSIGCYLRENRMEGLFADLKILISHFHPEKIIIINHLNCGYYLSLQFANSEVMHEEMVKDIREGSRLIGEKFPGIVIEGYILNHDSGELEKINLE